MKTGAASFVSGAQQIHRGPSAARTRKHTDMKHNSELSLCRLGTILSLVALAMMLMMLSACSPKTVYVPTETVRTDTLYRTALRIDSVILRDSVTIIRRGDTVYLTKYRDRFRYRECIDTVYQSATDSVRVRVPYPVERPLTQWERTKMELGGWAFGGIVVLLAVVAWLVFRKRRR